jgi:hypothetical protein
MECGSLLSVAWAPKMYYSSYQITLSMRLPAGCGSCPQAPRDVSFDKTVEGAVVENDLAVPSRLEGD